MKQNDKVLWFNSQLMKAHQYHSIALDEANHFSLSDKQQLGQVIACTELIDIEILQLLCGHLDLELLFDEENP